MTTTHAIGPGITRLIHRLPISVRLGRFMPVFDAAENAAGAGGPIRRQKTREKDLRQEIRALTTERDTAREALAVARDVINAVLGDPAEQLAADLEQARRTLISVRGLTSGHGEVVAREIAIREQIRRDYPHLYTDDDEEDGGDETPVRLTLARASDALAHGRKAVA